MADPVFLVRVVAAALVAVALSLGALNGWGDSTGPDKTPVGILGGH